MIPNDQPLRREMISRMLSVFVGSKFHNMTEWEISFIGSIRTQFDFKGDLSDKQCEILERLYDKL